MEKQFLDYEGLQELVAKIKEKYAMCPRVQFGWGLIDEDEYE